MTDQRPCPSRWDAAGRRLDYGLQRVIEAMIVAWLKVMPIVAVAVLVYLRCWRWSD